MDVMKERLLGNALDLRNQAADLRIAAYDKEMPPSLRHGVLSAAREAESASLGLEALAGCMADKE